MDVLLKGVLYVGMFNELGFAHHFEQNMKALGLPAPTSFYISVVVATATAKGMAEAIATYGRTATMGQIAFRVTAGYAAAPIVARAGSFILAVGAAFYAGACIGSIAVAVIKSAGCTGKVTVAQVMNWARENGIYENWIEAELISNPEILATIG